MKTCETCESWDSDSGDGVSKLCSHQKLSSGNLDTPVDGACDGEGYSGIYTGPEFCCIHHKSKEEVVFDMPPPPPEVCAAFCRLTPGLLASIEKHFGEEILTKEDASDLPPPLQHEKKEGTRNE